eukprot:GEMP01069727.1.p1 GENE.GEMP01069727.1~~GEMP01069727.1.p1  ORF type:complete len:286 (+),score=94.42 GEMP01069727.1:83-940(+)
MPQHTLATIQIGGDESNWQEKNRYKKVVQKHLGTGGRGMLRGDAAAQWRTREAEWAKKIRTVEEKMEQYKDQIQHMKMGVGENTLAAKEEHWRHTVRGLEEQLASYKDHLARWTAQMERESNATEDVWREQRLRLDEQIAAYKEEIRLHRRGNELDAQAIANKEQRWAKQLARHHVETQKLQKRWKAKEDAIHKEMRHYEAELRRARWGTGIADSKIAAAEETWKRKMHELQQELARYRMQVEVLSERDISKRGFDEAYNDGYRTAVRNLRHHRAVATLKQSYNS